MTEILSSGWSESLSPEVAGYAELASGEASDESESLEPWSVDRWRAEVHRALGSARA